MQAAFTLTEHFVAYTNIAGNDQSLAAAATPARRSPANLFSRFSFRIPEPPGTRRVLAAFFWQRIRFTHGAGGSQHDRVPSLSLPSSARAPRPARAEPHPLRGRRGGRPLHLPMLLSAGVERRLGWQ